MKKTLVTAVAVISVASAAAGCASSGSSGGAKKYSQSTLNVIVPSSPGGQLDIYARMLQPVLQSALGSTVIVTDNAAGDGVAAYSDVLQNGANCSYIAMGNVPQVLYDSMGGSAPIKPSQFAAMENFATDYGTLLVQKNGKYQTFQQLLAAAKANPGKVTVGFQSNKVSNWPGIENLEKVAGVKFNLVPFDGGAEQETALISGEIDAAAINVFVSQSLKSKTKTIAIQWDQNKWPDITDNAPTMAQVVGKTVEPVSAYYGFIAANSCRTQNPAVFSQLAGVIAKAAQSSQTTTKMQQLGFTGAVNLLGPAAFKSAAATVAQALGSDPIQ